MAKLTNREKLRATLMSMHYQFEARDKDVVMPSILDMPNHFSDEQCADTIEFINRPQLPPPTIKMRWGQDGGMYRTTGPVRERMLFADQLVNHIRAGGKVIDVEWEEEVTIEDINEAWGTDY